MELLSSLALYLRAINDYPVLSEDEERALARRKCAGDSKAQDKLVQHNLRFVVRIAKIYRGYGLSLEDLIDEGNIGLIKAVEKFDLDFGARLSTYAAWWIKQSIKGALSNQVDLVHLPSHVVESLVKIHNQQKNLNRDLND